MICLLIAKLELNIFNSSFADSSGAIIRTQDFLTNREHRICYDSTGRLISKELLDLSVTGSGDKWLHSLEYNYDLNNNITHFAFADRNVSFITAYAYGKDNLLEKTTLKDATIVDSNPDDDVDEQAVVSLSYTYDNLGRLTGKNLDTTNAERIFYINI